MEAITGTFRPRLLVIFFSLLFSAAAVLLLFAILKSTGSDVRLQASGETGIEAAGDFGASPETATPPGPTPPGPQTEFASFLGDYLNSSGAGAGTDNKPADGGPQAPWLGLQWPDSGDKGYVEGDGSILTISGRLLDPWGNGVPYIHIDAFLVLADGSLSGYTPPAGTVNPYPCVSLFDNYCPPNPVSDTDGYYSIPVAAPGMYKVFFNGMVTLTNETTASLYWWEKIRWPTAEWYNNSQSAGEAALVAAGSTGVDAILVPKGVLAGNINSYTVLFAPSPDAMAPNPPAVQVTAYRADREEAVASALVYSRVWTYLNVMHSFYFDSLAPGEYRILATPDYSGWDTDYYGSQLMKPTWFGGADSWETAQNVLVSGEPVSTIEIKMNEVGGVTAGASQPPQEQPATGGSQVPETNTVAVDGEAVGEGDAAAVEAPAIKEAPAVENAGAAPGDQLNQT